MKSVIKQVAIFYIVFSVLCVPTEFIFATQTYDFSTVTKTATFRFNNENWFTEVHPKIASFSIHEDGSASGLTETGTPFIQYNIPNSVGIRVQRFEIEDHYHYIINGEIAYSFEDLSARLAQAYDVRDMTAS